MHFHPLLYRSRYATVIRGGVVYALDLLVDRRNFNLIFALLDPKRLASELWSLGFLHPALRGVFTRRNRNTLYALWKMFSSYERETASYSSLYGRSKVPHKCDGTHGALSRRGTAQGQKYPTVRFTLGNSTTLYLEAWEYDFFLVCAWDFTLYFSDSRSEEC